MPNHGTAIAVPTHTIVRPVVPSLRGLIAAAGCALTRKRTSGSLAATGVGGSSATSLSATATAAGESARRRGAAAARTDGLATHARQPACTKSYCDLGTKRDAPFMIWNDAEYMWRLSPVTRRAACAADSPRRMGWHSTGCASEGAADTANTRIGSACLAIRICRNPHLNRSDTSHLLTQVMCQTRWTARREFWRI